MLDPEEYYLDGYGYYCPICGETQIAKKGLIRCVNCLNMVYLKRTIYEWEYYKKKAIELNNTSKNLGTVIREIIFDEEASKNPCFSAEAHEKNISHEEHDRVFAEDKRKAKEKRLEANKPKCPTCGSINIEKISTTSKVIGATMFGLLSKTARSQFKCKNCGYKW